MKKEYTIGLDIGTNSVGWAVLTENYDLVKKKMKVYGTTETKYLKKNLWGVRLFDEGKTAADRRLKRTTRRRYSRRRNRICRLQDLFTKEMNQVDANFFHRLQESFLVPDEKEFERHAIFGTMEEEVSYYRQFPTIYHLRKHLADTSEQSDLRLVYLALAHIVKYRGHFLIEGELNTENSSVSETFRTFIQVYNQIFRENEVPLAVPDNIEELFSEKVPRARKVEAILSVYSEEKSTGTLAQFLKLMVGNQGRFKKTFDLEEDGIIQIPKEEYEEELETLLAIIGDEYAEIFSATKSVYDAVALSGILSVTDGDTKAKLSASMVERYEAHQKDLVQFKQFIRKELPEMYALIFRDNSVSGYAGYVENSKVVTQAEFYKYIKKVIEKVPGAEYFLEKIEQETFLDKQRTFNNGVIPHQIHLEELEAIIQKQATYYPFLADNKEEMKQLVTFRIPYYVGPLADGNSPFAWLERISSEPIRPGNLAEVVDINKSATKFIERMTNFDTYLPTEKVLPKHSMIYEKYMVYNELTKVSYVDERGMNQRFSGEEKKQIVEELFKQSRKVTKKLLEKFLSNEFGLVDVAIEGIETSFNAGYGTYHDFLKIGITREQLDKEENSETLEEIVKILTVFEDRKMIREQLKKYTYLFDEEVLKKLERRHYTGWGRLSAKLLIGIKEKRTHKTILDYLIEDDGGKQPINRNLMQLINDSDLSFKSEIAEAQSDMNTEDLHEVVQNLAGSPAIKKGILQSLKIVDELVDIMGSLPKNIVVEMARENQTTSRGRTNSNPRMRALEEAMRNLHSNLLKEYPTDNQALQNDRLYLYYLQNGKDMYTGLDLSLHNLSSYDIDHIVPQSFTTDNSLDNRVLVSSKENRGKKDDVPSKEVVQKNITLWETLKNSSLISQKKYDNLTKGLRGGLTEDDRAHFIKRQLVETRQITKHVARILDQRFNSQKDEEGKTIRAVRVVTLKSSLTSQFRKQFAIHKVREINDYHHGHDAYLNGVVANSLLRVYPQLQPEFVYGDYPKFNAYKANKATAKKQLYTNIMKFFAEDAVIIDENGEILWDKKNIATVKKVMSYPQMNIVKKPEIQTGSFSKETIKPKGDSDKLISRKTNWSPKLYGGFDSPQVAYSVIITYEKGKKKVRAKAIVGITIMEQSLFKKDPISLLEEKGYANPEVLVRLPKYTLYELENGRRRLLASANEAQKGNQLVLPASLVTLLYHAKQVDEDSGKSEEYVREHRAEFAEILNHVQAFSETKILANKNLQTILKLYEENKEADIKEIAESFVNLMKFSAYGAPMDFKFFGKTIPRSRYTSVGELLNATIINQSITGLYETRRKLVD